MRLRARHGLALWVAVALLSSCSVKKYAIGKVGDALAAPGPSVYETDDDIELVGGALPFSLKFVESLLVEAPYHRGLLLTACRGFTLYAYAYVDFEAEKTIEKDLAQGRKMRERAKRLYLRAFDYGVRAIETRHPGFGDALRRTPTEAVAVFEPKRAVREIPLIYWTASSLGLAIGLAKDDAAMLARIPEVEALIERAVELDPDWEDGSLDEYQVTFASAKPGGGDPEIVRNHYDRALRLSGGKRGGLFVAFAEAFAEPEQDHRLFRQMMERAQAIDVDAVPRYRLVNSLAKRRAEWLSGRIDELFLIQDETSEPQGENP